MNIPPSAISRFLPYAGKKAALATMHGKEAAIAPGLRKITGLIVVGAAGIDTDKLGTFAGDVPRDGTMLEVAIRKARMGMDVTGFSLGIASEGAFGPHPVIPFIAAGTELMTFVDDERKIVVTESCFAEETNFGHLTIEPGQAHEPFLLRVGFPSHALIVRPNECPPPCRIFKGIQTVSDLDRAIGFAASLSVDGKARLETDMRAHLNPTRMKRIALLTERLARRLTTPCPEYDEPGFGRSGARAGLICADCCAPTGMIAAEFFCCPSCNYEEARPRADGLTKAPAGSCPECNP